MVILEKLVLIEWPIYYFFPHKISVIYPTSTVLLLVFSLCGNSTESKPTISTLQIPHDINATEQGISEGSAKEKSGLLVTAHGEKDDMAISDNSDENALHSEQAHC